MGPGGRLRIEVEGRVDVETKGVRDPVLVSDSGVVHDKETGGGVLDLHSSRVLRLGGDLSPDVSGRPVICSRKEALVGSPRVPFPN